MVFPLNFLKTFGISLDLICTVFYCFIVSEQDIFLCPVSRGTARDVGLHEMKSKSALV